MAFAFAMLVCGFLYWNMIDFFLLGAGIAVFAAALFAVSFVYLTKSGHRQNAMSLMCLAFAGISAAGAVVFDNRLVGTLNLLFLSVMYVCWVCLTTGRRIDGKLSIYVLGDAVKQGILVPFLNFGCCASAIKNGFFKQKRSKGALAALVGVLAFLPALAAVVNLLVAADAAFESFAVGLLEAIRIEAVLTYAGQLIAGVPVAFYLYGLVYGDSTGRRAGSMTVESVDKAAGLVRIAPKITISSALGAFILVYFVFFAVQATYLFSAVSGSLPGGFTYAEYARRGFFELCAVAGINLCVLAACHLAVRRGKGEEPLALRIETALISVFTILLIVTALSKMAMYIDAYGLTRLRVYTSWFMALLLIVFVIVIARQIRRFNSTRAIVAASVLMFLLLSCGNADGFIAKRNIEMHEAGMLAALDVDALGELSDAAVPHMYGLYVKTGEDDHELRERLLSAMMERQCPSYGGFRTFNLQRHRAEEIRSLLTGNHR